MVVKPIRSKTNAKNDGRGDRGFVQRFTFVVRKLSYDPGGFVSVEVNVQDVTEPLRVQVTARADHLGRREAALPPGDVGHDVHWNLTRKKKRKMKKIWQQKGGRFLRGTRLCPATPTWLRGDDQHRFRAVTSEVGDDSSVQVHVSLDHAHVRLVAPCVCGHHDNPGARRGGQV